MQSLGAYSLMVSATLVAAFTPDPRFEYPDTVPPIVKRQEPGTPAYACHEDCGLLITLGRTDGYCDSDEWNERYDRCMICANTFNIWQYYGGSISKLAEECGLDAKPSASGSSSSSASTTSAMEEKEKITTKAEPVTTKASETTKAEEQEKTSEAAQSTSAAGEETDEVSSLTAISEDSPKETEANATTTIGHLRTGVVTPTPTPTDPFVNTGVKHVGVSAAGIIAALAAICLY